MRLGRRIASRNKEQTLIELPLPNCKECPINAPGNIKHSYRGPVPCRIMFMGEAPSATEQKVGEVFRGRAGKLLSAVLEETGFNEDSEVFICNTLLCRPPDNRTPKAPEIKACAPNIEAIIEAIKPEIIVPVGNIALKWLTKRTGVMTWHGTKMDSPYGLVIPAIHPAHALRSGAKIHPRSKEEQMQGIRGFLVTDFKYIRSVLDGTEEKFEEKTDTHFDYRLISTIKDLTWVYEEIQKHDDIAVDIETTGLIFYQDRIIGIAFSWAEGQGVYIPLLVKEDDLGLPQYQKIKRIRSLNSIHEKLRQITGGRKVKQEFEPKHQITKEWYEKKGKKGSKKKKLSNTRLVSFWGAEQPAVKDLLASILSIKGKRWYGWNFKFDQKFIITHLGTDIFPLAGDGLFQAYLIDENTPNDLKSNTDVNIPELQGYANELRRAISQSDLDEEKLANVPLPVLYKYGCGDVDATLRLTKLQDEVLGHYKNLRDLYHRDFYLKLHQIYTAAEIEGYLVDPEWVEKVGHDRLKKIEALEKQMFEATGREFNPNSGPQLVEVIYGEDSVFKIPIPTDKRMLTETGKPSTKELVLKDIFYDNDIDSPISAFIRLLLEHKKYSKEMSTYVIGCTEELDRFNHAHGTFNLIGATTGRFSCKRIPIQTIPREPLMRGMFIAHKNWYLIEADYSQVELREAAWYSRDPVMTKEFANGEDVHRNTAAEIFGIPRDQVSKDQRKYAKSTNFGSLYEGSSRTLAESINDKIGLDETPVSVAQATKFQEAWARRYRGFIDWRYKVHHKAMKDQFVVGPLGRIRRLPAAVSEDNKDRAEALRQGPNSLIQGLGSDLGEMALVRIIKRAGELGLYSRFRWSLHDALFIEAPACEVKITCQIMKEEMERQILDGLFTPVEFKVFKERWAGEYWEDLDEINEIFGARENEPVTPIETLLTTSLGRQKVYPFPG